MFSLIKTPEPLEKVIVVFRDGDFEIANYFKGDYMQGGLKLKKDDISCVYRYTPTAGP